MNMMDFVKKYIRFVRIEHTLFSLPIVFSGAFLARSPLLVQTFLWIFLAVLGARSAGFGLNRIIDRSIDAVNPRTKDREIPSGRISVTGGWIFVVAFAVLFFVAAAKLSPVCLALAPIPLALFWFYPYLKRWTVWTHLGLGLAWGTAPLGGWIAVRPVLCPVAQVAPVLWLTLFSVFWVAGFDILYALLDEEFDREHGIYSLPAKVGAEKAVNVSAVAHGIAWIFLAILTVRYLAGPISFGLLIAAAVLLAVAQWTVRKKPLTPDKINYAFFKVNAVLSVAVLLMVVL